jgi:hypothetical protein
LCSEGAPAERPAARHFGASPTQHPTSTGANRSQCKRVIVTSDTHHPGGTVQGRCSKACACILVKIPSQSESNQNTACSQHTKADCSSLELTARPHSVRQLPLQGSNSITVQSRTASTKSTDTHRTRARLIHEYIHWNCSYEAPVATQRASCRQRHGMVHKLN